MERIGFIGLGNIGEPMAARILAAGFDVASCANRRRDVLESLAGSGLREVASPAEVAAECDILITCVRDEAQTDAVLDGRHGAFGHLSRGAVLIITSTVLPQYCQDLAARLSERGVELLDCPVSGGRAGATQGSLALICGGDQRTVERCRPVLETMGTVHHTGAVGTGQAAKLVNQGLLFSAVKLLQEGRALAKTYDLDPDVLMGVLADSTANSWVAEHWEMFVSVWPHIGALGKKDVTLCVEAARSKGLALPLIEARRDLSWELAPDD